MDYLLMRSLCALISGMIISQTGSLIQLSTRNILASPSTLGFDGMSVFWILIFHSLILLFNQESSYALLFLIGLPLFILLGIGFSAFLFRVKNVDRLILLGLTFNLLVGGIFSFCHFVFLAFNLPFPVELWFGHFRYADSTGLILIGIVEIALILNLFFIRQNLALFSVHQHCSRHFCRHIPFWGVLILGVNFPAGGQEIMVQKNGSSGGAYPGKPLQWINTYDSGRTLLFLPHLRSRSPCRFDRYYRRGSESYFPFVEV